MLFNLIKFSLRHHAKHRIHALINVFGLALGITCFSILALLVKSQLSHDDYHEQKDLIYEVYSPLSEVAGKNESNRHTAPTGPFFTDELPEVVDYARFNLESNLEARVNDERVIVPKLYFTDASAFEFFSLKFLTTNTTQLVFGLNEIVISQSVAERLFGSAESAIGQPFELVGLKQMTVSAVFEDLPQYSHLAFDYLISFDHVNEFKKKIYQDPDWNFVGWRSGAYPTYIKLNEPIDEIGALEEKLSSKLSEHWSNRKVTLVALDDVYFSEWNQGYFKPAGDDTYLSLYLLIAVIILVVAIVNYTNLSTASFIRRVKEVGIRKAIGGQRRQLVLQFLTETFVLVMMASVLALCLFEFAVPFFNSYTGQNLSIDYTQLQTYLGFLGFTFFIGLVAGIYPAFFLSAFSPKQGMKVSPQGTGKGFFRKLLVGFQFTACLALMVVTGIVFSQHEHLRELDPGFKKDFVVGIKIKDDRLQKSYAAFKAELLKNAQVSDVAGASMDIFNDQFVIETEVNEDHRITINWARVEANLLDLLNLKVKEGEPFDTLKGNSERSGMLLNEAAVEATGWEYPLEKKVIDAKVQGVVKDFIFGSAREVVSPLMLSEGGGKEYAYVYAVLKGNMGTALDAVKEVFESFSSEYPFEYQFLDDQLAAKYEQEQRMAEAFAIFSIITLIIACLGILGFSVFVAETRTKEIGIRKVMGAGVSRIVWLLNGRITFLVLGVACFTLPASWYLMGQWLDSFAVRVNLGLSNFLIPLVILTVAVWSIMLYHSLKAARLNPVKALRTD